MVLKFVLEMKFVVSNNTKHATLWKKKIYYPISLINGRHSETARRSIVKGKLKGVT